MGTSSCHSRKSEKTTLLEKSGDVASYAQKFDAKNQIEELKI